MSDENKEESVAEKVLRANVANIIKKVNAGGTLTKGEQAALAEWQAKETEKKQDGRIPTKQWAKFWRVSEVTIRNMMKRCKAGGMPAVNDVPAILKWEKFQVKKSPAFAARCEELRAESGEGEGAAAGTPAAPKEDADWIRFREAGTAPMDHGAQVKTLEMFRDGYAMKLEAAMRKGDTAAIREWNSLLIETTNAIRQSKLAAEKLGYEEGNIISFEVMEQCIGSLGYWLMRSVDRQLDGLAARLASLPPGAGVNDYRKACEEQLMGPAWAIPWANASKPSGVSLPARAIAKFRSVCGDYLENGDEIFRQEVAKIEAAKT